MNETDGIERKNKQKSIIMVGYFNTPLSATDRSNGKISKNKEDMSNSISQYNLTDIYRIQHRAKAYYTFSRAHEIVTKTNHMLVHEIRLE